MLKIVFATLCCVLTFQVAAQLIISGTIRDTESKDVLINATVEMANGSDYAISDEQGRFELNVPKGQHQLKVRSLGYEDKAIEVTVEEDVQLNVMMDGSVRMTDEVVIRATRANNETPTTFTNVGKKTLREQNFGQDMPFLLNWTPSLVTTSDAGAGIGYTGLRIRGSDASRINVTINGIPYNDSESQGTFWVDIPDIASSTESVQVQRGVGTSTNGGSAFGGTVNVQTNSLNRDTYAEGILAYGSFNTQRYTFSGGTGLINDRWSFDGKVSHITSDGYIDRASSDLSSYYISGGYYGDNTVIKAITFGGQETTYQSWNGNDEETLGVNRTFNSAGALYDESWNVIGYYDNEVDDYRQDHYQLHLSQRLGSAWDANISLHYTNGRGYYEQYQQAVPFADLGLNNIMFSDTTLTYGDFITRKWLDNKFYGTTFSIHYNEGKSEVTIGGAINQYGDAKHFGEIIWGDQTSNSGIRHQYYQGASEKNDFNIYGKWNYEIVPSLNAFVDLQYRTVGYQTAGIDDDLMAYDVDDDFDFFNPKAGLSYSQGNDLFYASYAIANREPNRTDYLSGTGEPSAEKLDNVELGWRRNTDKHNIGVNYYLMNYTNQLVFTGELDNVGNPIRANVGESYRTGIEITGAFKLSSRLNWNFNATWSQNKNAQYLIDENDPNSRRNTTIVLSPSWIGGSQLTWNAFHGFQAGLLSKFVGKQYLDNTQTETLTLDSYFINDLRINYALPVAGISEWNISLLVNNLFGVTYSSNGYSYDGVAYYYPQAGINYMLMTTIGF